mmetsp:Transcript_100487/g.319209  ORF Transcript_100487/g.319209 Transcript_100487/m.319209 type:complete len:351 (-) Transcript_100487:1771-2823(-)
MPGFEELRVPNVLIAVYARAESLLWLPAHEPLHESAPILVTVASRKGQRILEHRSAHLCGIVQLVCKRQEATDELKEHHTQRPKVHLGAVPVTSHHLRGHVVRRPDHGEGPEAALLELLGNAKVYELEVALLVQHDVLWLQVPVYNVLVGQLLEDDDEGARVELRMSSGEDRGNRSDGAVELTAGDKLREDVHALRGLKRVHQRHNEWVVGFLQKITLSLDLVWDLAILLHHTLQSIPHLRLLVPDEAHNTCCSSTDDLDVLEVLERDARVLQPDAVHQLLLHVAFDNLREGGLLDGPELGLAAHDLHSGGARLIEEQGTFAKVRILSKSADQLTVNHHGHLPVGNHEEG